MLLALGMAIRSRSESAKPSHRETANRNYAGAFPGVTAVEVCLYFLGAAGGDPGFIVAGGTE